MFSIIFIYLLSICISCLVKIFCPFLPGGKEVVFLLNLGNSLYLLNTKSLANICLQIFSSLLLFFLETFKKQEVLNFNLILIKFSLHFLTLHAFRILPKKYFLNLVTQQYSVLLFRAFKNCFRFYM